jgi:arylsulfatase A-like enzyme
MPKQPNNTSTNHQPNILFIVLDTLRRDRLSLYGDARATSPYLDDFAQKATTFERAIAPAQWTIPSHGSLFTGLYPTTHGFTQAFHQLPETYPTLAELLRFTDYHTVAFCNNPLVGVLDNGLQRGFEHFYNYAGASPNRPQDTSNARLRWARESFEKVARRVTNQFAHSDLLFRMSINPLIVPFWTRFANFTGNTAQSIDDLIAYWDRHHAGGKEQPLFAFVNLMGAHLPYRPPRNYVATVAPELANDKHAMRYMARFNAQPQAWTSPTEEPLEDWQSATLEAFYGAEIAHQDYHLGRLLKHLEDSGQLDDTMVVILADHGEGHGEHDFMGHSFVVYQELVHVPLVIHYPERFPKAERITHNISTRRLFHTVLDIAGAQPPFNDDNPNHDIERLSLAYLMGQEDILNADVEGGRAYAEAVPPETLLRVLRDRQPETVQRLRLEETRRGLYEGDYKLALVGDSVERLFNVGNDPAELFDASSDESAHTERLARQLRAFIEEAQALRTTAIMNGRVDDSVMESLRALGYID